MQKKLWIESYGTVVIIAVASRAMGNYDIFTKCGLTSSFWAIIMGILVNATKILENRPEVEKDVVSGEFFIKIGVTMLAMDFSSIVSIGVPGLVVAWVDTIIVMTFGIWIATNLMKMGQKEAVVVAGATSICGSSAATAIGSALGGGPAVGATVDAIIALMGLLNTPLMPVMPLASTLGGLNPRVVGAWIGGSIDSTGQVVASASLGSNAVLQTATVIKIAQNFLIGPICLVLTMIFQKTYKPHILIDKFPIFVIGFFITSTVVTIINHAGDTSGHVRDLCISNSWAMGEWINLLGFARIGLKIDVLAFFRKKKGGDDDLAQTVLHTYLFIQAVDLMTTFAWSYLVFHDASYSDDDDGNDV